MADQPAEPVALTKADILASWRELDDLAQQLRALLYGPSVRITGIE